MYILQSTAASRSCSRDLSRPGSRAKIDEMMTVRLAPSSRGVLGVLLVAALVVSCRREERSFRALRLDRPPRDLDANAYVIATGARLFESFNCVGCHGHGARGMGPPLM